MKHIGRETNGMHVIGCSTTGKYIQGVRLFAVTVYAVEKINNCLKRVEVNSFFSQSTNLQVCTVCEHLNGFGVFEQEEDCRVLARFCTRSALYFVRRWLK